MPKSVFYPVEINKKRGTTVPWSCLFFLTLLPQDTVEGIAADVEMLTGFFVCMLFSIRSNLDSFLHAEDWSTPRARATLQLIPQGFILGSQVIQNDLRGFKVIS